MFELAFIEQCADPGIEVSIVERFIATVGTDNPLAVSITSGNRVILPEPPSTPEDAMRLIERFVGQAAVRVGVTRYPAGHGIADVTELDSTILDACANIGLGSALFGKVYRIVAHAQGGADNATFQQAVAAWNTGMFEGRYVFGEPDPGPLPIDADGEIAEASTDDSGRGDDPLKPVADPNNGDAQAIDPYQAGIRVDLKGLLPD